MDASHPLPLRPSSSSLSSHIAALDDLALRLHLLSSRTRWTARVPINSKASVLGEVERTNDVRVKLGREGWWVEMTSEEAAGYVNRRKDALLEEHARILEGKSRLTESDIISRSLIDIQTPNPSRPAETPFDTFFAHPIRAEPSTAQGTPVPPSSAQVPSTAAPGVTSLAEASGTPGPSMTELEGETQAPWIRVDVPEVEEPISLHDEDAQRSSSVSELRAGREQIVAKQTNADAESIDTLVDLVESLQGKLHLPPSVSNDATVSDERGLSIHEIRETLSGDTIGPQPEGAGEGIEIPEDQGDDFWSLEAVARRAALRSRVFREGGSSDEDEDEDDDGDEEKGKREEGGEEGEGEERSERLKQGSEDMSALPSTASTRRSHPIPSSAPTFEPEHDPEPDTDLNPLPSRTSSTPKSILKPPIRKKSVSFDPSVPLPPDSPPASDARSSNGSGKLGFRMPVEAEVKENVGEFEPRPVPVINAPTPPSRNEFAGFKKGFLVNKQAQQLPPSQQQQQRAPQAPRAKVGPAAAFEVTGLPPKFAPLPPSPAPPPVLPTPPTTAIPSPSLSTKGEGSEKSGVAPEPPRKQSLFAQRRAAAASGSGSVPALPKMSEAKPMSTMKNTVMEKPQPQVQAQVVPPVVSSKPSAAGANGVPPAVARTEEIDEEVDEEDEEERSETDEDEFGDLGEFSDDEEDEYDLDEALLAREVALEYHRRQAWRRQLDEDEEDDGGEGASGGGGGGGGGDNEGVMLGVPSVSSITGGHDTSSPLRIVNPTPDDLNQFLRVGRADDGTLVLEPPVVGSSGSESEGVEEGAGAEDRRRRRERRREVRRRLVLGQYGDEWERGEEELREGERRKRGMEREGEMWKESVPPVVRERVSAGKEKEEKVEQMGKEEKAGPVAGVVERVPQGQAVKPSNAGGGSGETEPEAPQPKKVSRFKAARLAGAQ